MKETILILLSSVLKTASTNHFPRPPTLFPCSVHEFAAAADESLRPAAAAHGPKPRASGGLPPP